jgi:hypothetical protein
VLAGWIACGACAGHRVAPAESKRMAGGADLLVPPGAEQLCVTFEAGTLPGWRVQDSQGNCEITREIRVVKGRPVQLLLRADRECTLQIPAMRIRAVAIPDRFQTAWFLPVEPGEYEILVRSGTEQYDGRVIVAGDKTP